MKRLIISSLLILLAIPLIYSQLTSDDFMQFKYKDIPFGKGMSKVDSLISNEAEIETPDNNNIENFYSHVSIRDYFSKGVYSVWGMGSYLADGFVKKQIIKNYSKWTNIESVDIYFVKSFNSEDEPTLFMVRKGLSYETGNLTNVFNGFQTAITKQLNKPAKIINSDYIWNTGNHSISRIAIWDTGTNLLFLMVLDNGIFRYPEFLYVSKAGWNKYIKGTVAYEKSKVEKEKEKAKKSVENF